MVEGGSDLALVRWCPVHHIPTHTVSINHGTREAAPLLPNPVHERPRDWTSLLGGRPKMSQNGLRRVTHYKASTLSFNPTFVLEFHITGNKGLIAICLFFYIFPVYRFSPFLLLLLTVISQNVTPNRLLGFLCSMG